MNYSGTSRCRESISQSGCKSSVNGLIAITASSKKISKFSKLNLKKHQKTAGPSLRH